MFVSVGFLTVGLGWQTHSKSHDLSGEIDTTSDGATVAGPEGSASSSNMSPELDTSVLSVPWNAGPDGRLGSTVDDLLYNIYVDRAISDAPWSVFNPFY